MAEFLWIKCSRSSNICFKITFRKKNLFIPWFTKPSTDFTSSWLHFFPVIHAAVATWPLIHFPNGPNSPLYVLGLFCAEWSSSGHLYEQLPNLVLISTCMSFIWLKIALQLPPVPLGCSSFLHCTHSYVTHHILIPSSVYYHSYQNAHSMKIRSRALLH